MDDIVRQDRKLFWREATRPARIVLAVVGIAFVLGPMQEVFSGVWKFALCLAVLAGHALASYNASLHRRWLNPHFHSLWKNCLDRLERFRNAQKDMRRDQVADLQEMPKTIEKVGSALYLALRRADMIADEVHRSERGLQSAPATFGALSHDAQAKELYRIADKNLAEYRQQFAGVMAGVQRAEAQAAVFVTTLDSVRMKMIGHRLAGRKPEMSTYDFLEALGEAKLQLQAIDKALDELDFSTMPKTIVVQPPPTPVDAMEEHRLGGPPR